MYCPKCGTQLNDNDSYCPKCGAKVESVNQNTNFNVPFWNHYHFEMTKDKGIAFFSIFCMLFMMVVPYVVATTYNQGYTLFSSLDRFIMSAYGNGWQTLFIIALVVFILMFGLDKYFGKTKIMSIIGCCGIWTMFIITIIEVITTNYYFGYGMFVLGFGFYVWIFSNILATISIIMDKRNFIKIVKTE